MLFGVAAYGKSLYPLVKAYQGFHYAFKGFYLTYVIIISALSLLMVVIPTSIGLQPRFYFLDAVIMILGPIVCGPIGEAVADYLAESDAKKELETMGANERKRADGEVEGMVFGIIEILYLFISHPGNPLSQTRKHSRGRVGQTICGEVCKTC